MGFLTKHYEKIILALFLLVFVFSLVYLIMVFRKSKEITMGDLGIDPEGDNYPRIFTEDGKEDLPEGKKGKYSYEENLEEEAEWTPSGPREKGSLDHSDLLVPFEAARCFECFKVIPRVSFDKEICPLCGKDPGPIVDKPDELPTDTDGDEMLDSFEKAIAGMNYENAGDKWTDLDDDGYPNIMEHDEKTLLNDAKSHPPLAMRVSLVSINRMRIPIVLKNVTKRRGAEGKKDWQIYYKTYNKSGKETTDFKQIGEEIVLYTKGRRKFVFKIIDAEIKTVEVFDRTIKQPVDKNVSEIKIQDADDDEGEPITVVVGRRAYENKARLVFQDYITKEEYKARDGEMLKVGDEKVGTEEYKIVEIKIDLKNKEKESVKLEDSKKRLFDIKKTSELEELIKKGAETGTGTGTGTGINPNEVEDPYLKMRDNGRPSDEDPANFKNLVPDAL